MIERNQYSPNDIRCIVRAVDCQRQFVFALSSAQRTIVLAAAVVDGGLRASDLPTADSALELCWELAESRRAELPSGLAPGLWEHLVPDDAVDFTAYNAVVNDVFATLIYTIGSLTDDPPDSPYWASRTLLDLTDYLYQRRFADSYAPDADNQATDAAARYISVDVDLLIRQEPPNLPWLRAKLIDEGAALARLVG
jgi:hypothetical protein